MAATHAVPVDPSNVGALESWDGPDGDHWTDHEAIYEASLDRYRDRFFAAAAIGTADRVLDLGCGTGQSTRDAARLASSGAALGIDLSSRMIDRARERSVEEGVHNVEFVQADAQIHQFEPGAFDVAIGRCAAMFFGDPVAAFANVNGALRPAGRLTLFVWQTFDQNAWTRDLAVALADGGDASGPPPDAPGAFSWANPDRVRSILAAAGFVDVELEAAEAGMSFGASADVAYQFVISLGFSQWKLGQLPDDAARARAMRALRASIDAHVTDDGVRYPSSGWIVTARRP